MNKPSKAMIWAGRIMSALPVLLLVFSGVMKLTKSSDVIEGFAKLGYPERYIIGIGIAELVSTLLYIIPRTSVLGAILLTGYLGGAIATHVRMEENFAGPAAFGMLVWGGLWLRDLRIRELIPICRCGSRQPPAETGS